MKRLWKPLLALAAIGAALTLTITGPRPSGLKLDIDPSPRARAAQSQEPYDLSDLKILNRTILEIKDHYVEPDRVDPRKMLLSGLNAIQQNVAPVLVHYDEGDPKVTVQVHDARESFRVDDVDSPWALATRFREVFGFLQKHLADEPDLDLRKVEYAAINGMLQTLDPHSLLLVPDVFEEMQTTTRGEFGGLGIHIAIRDGRLTVVEPMPGTPAANAGLESGDRIVQIEQESTLNMPLTEAVNRLRGAPGSTVHIWVTSKEKNGHWSAARKVAIVRAIIHIDSVEHRMLPDHVGYVRIRNFQGNTAEDLRSALDDLHGKDLKALILDLRGNPGGLLDAAARVADTFLSSGSIVRTSSPDPSQRDEKFAHRRGTEPDYPMVVLINGGSASASEIVAGALKNHNRALIVGQRSFGKGSVQILYNFPDGSALKLTVAQYLTPGDVSIQGVGIQPDIIVKPMTVDRDDMDLFPGKTFLSEADLRSHLTHAHANEAPEDSLHVRYYLSEATREKLRNAIDPEQIEDLEEVSFLRGFARKLLASAKHQDRLAMLADAKPLVAEVDRQQMKLTIAALRKLGVDWSAGEDAGPQKLSVAVSTDPPNGEAATAGGPFTLTVRVTNDGKAPAYRVRATTKSDYDLFDGRELVFGRVDPGQTRAWTTTLGVCDEDDAGKRACTIPRSTLDRADGIEVTVTDGFGHEAPPVELRTTVHALPRPLFAYSVDASDVRQGNGDGAIQRGEGITLYLRLKNTGVGRTYDAQANLSNLSGPGVLLHDGRFELPELKPGDAHVVPFTFDVLPDFKKDEIKVGLSVVDTELGEALSEKLRLPVAGKGAAVEPRTGSVTVKDGASVRSAPAEDASVLARAKGALGLPAQAHVAGFTRVDLGKGQPGWVADADVTRSPSDPHATLDPVYDHMPPRLHFNGTLQLVTKTPTVRIDGSVSDPRGVRDLYIFSGARKVFYQSSPQGARPTETKFATDVALHGGINYVTIVARESEDVVSRKTFVVRRDAPDGSLMKTPKFDEDNPLDDVEAP